MTQKVEKSTGNISSKTPEAMNELPGGIGLGVTTHTVKAGINYHFN
jgi:hypothetical protein